MRTGWRFQAFVAVCIGLSFIFSSAAFSGGDLTPRSVIVNVVGDGSAYVSLAANGPHSCFVDNGGAKLSITFDSTVGCASSGGGTGVNAGGGADASKYTRYAFHDIIKITNKGTKSVRVWVNATTTSSGSSELAVDLRNSEGLSTLTSYSAAKGPLTIAPGGSLYVGVRAHTGTLNSGSITGSIKVEANLV